MVYARSVPLAKEWRLRCILNIMFLNVTLFSFKNTLLWKTCFFIILWIITKCYSKEQSQEPCNLLNVKQSRCYFKVQRFDLMNAKHLKSTGNFFNTTLLDILQKGKLTYRPNGILIELQVPLIRIEEVCCYCFCCSVYPNIDYL